MRKILTSIVVLLLVAAPYAVYADQTNGSDVEPVTVGGTNGSPTLTVPANGGTQLTGGTASPGTVPFSQMTSAPNTSFVGAGGNLNYVPLEPLPFINSTSYSNGNIANILNGLITILVISGGFLAVGLFVFYGIEYMLSDVVGTKFNAKERLKSAFWGLLLLLGAYIILYTINPQLLNFYNIFNPTTGVATVGTSAVTGAAASAPASAAPPSAATINQQMSPCSVGGGGC
jgi:hypothetical protein